MRRLGENLGFAATLVFVVTKRGILGLRHHPAEGPFLKKCPGLALVLAIAGVYAASFPAPSLAETSPIPPTTDPPWTDPAHGSSLEVLAGQIASRIANRQVTIRCEGEYDWGLLVSRRGGDPNAELGYVSARWYSSGRLSDISGFAEISGNVCLALQNFALAASKPTKCSVSSPQWTTVSTPQRVRVQVTSRVHGRLVHRWVWTTRQVSTMVATQVAGAPQLCYLGNNRAATVMPDSFWSDYRSYAEAILTLAHESIHLGGVVGGQLGNGLLVGDQQAEAKATCYGMQWMPYVAEQLGDTPDDAMAIAQWMVERYYPAYQGSAHPQYWSAECKPGGALDIRAPGSTVWP